MGPSGGAPLARRRFLGGLLALPVLAACGDGSGEALEEAASPSTAAPGTTAPALAPPPPSAGPTFPLTGLAVDDPARAARSALVVKVANGDSTRASFQARPQAGVNQADVVVEELTEGSVTRLACVFHSTDADPVGPVRSFRTTDIDLVAGLGRPLFAYSGANGDFLRALREADVAVDVGLDSATSAYRRVGDRVAPQNLMASTPALFAAAAGGGPPPAWFTFRPDPAASPGVGAQPVGGVSIVFGTGAGSAPVDYTWDPTQGWVRHQKGTPHVDAAGVQVAPANVVVQFVDYVDSGARDSSGAVVPEGIVVGSGPAWVLTAGLLVEGTWSKPDRSTPTTFLDAAGAPIGLTPGRTWMALAPPGSATLR